jgi:hypothetical protein
VKTRIAAIVSGASVAGALLLSSGVTSAHPVGDASEPNCHGQRVSHGASHSKVKGGHELTPVERRDIIAGIIGEEISMGEWHEFVKMCLPPEPPV